MKKLILVAAAAVALSACASQDTGWESTLANPVDQHRIHQNDNDTVFVGTDTVISAETRARGVADGSEHSRDNLTSMGTAVSDGANIMRVRSTTSQTVSLREAGGGTVEIEVDAGDTLVEVSPGATVIAEFSESGRKVTKASGPQDFNDVTEVETEVDVYEEQREE